VLALSSIKVDRQEVHGGIGIQQNFYARSEATTPPELAESESELSPDDAFEDLLDSSARLACSRLNLPAFQETALYALPARPSELAPCSLSDFDDTKVCSHPATKELLSRIERAWEEVLGANHGDVDRMRRALRDELIGAYSTLVNSGLFKAVRRYLDSNEYRQNLKRLLRKQHQETLVFEFAREPLPQDPALTLRDIYVEPMCTIVDAGATRQAELESTSAAPPARSTELTQASSPTSPWTMRDSTPPKAAPGPRTVRKLAVHDMLRSLFNENASQSLLSNHSIGLARIPKSVLVFGYPGQGKTSICKRVAHDVATGAFPALEAAYILPLRDLPPLECHRLEEEPLAYISQAILTNVFSNRVGGASTGDLRGWLVILDGLDELDNSALRDKSYQALLDRLFGVPDQAGFLLMVTSRYAAVRPELLTVARPPLVMRLEEFDVSQQKQWLANYRKYHPSGHLTPDILNEIAAVSAKSERLTSLIEKKATLDSDKRLVRQRRDRHLTEVDDKLAKVRRSMVAELKVESLQRAVADLGIVEELENAANNLIRAFPNTQLPFTAELIHMRTNWEAAKAACLAANGKLATQLARERADLNREYGVETDAAELDLIDAELDQLGREEDDIRAHANSLDTRGKTLLAVRELVSQPLLLYLIARLDVDLADTGAPLTRLAIYDQITTRLIDDLFRQLVQPTILDRSRPRSLIGASPATYREFIGDLAFAIHAQGGEAIEFESAEVLVEAFQTKLEKCDAAIRASLNSLLPTFYLRERRLRQIEFVHKTFREYMTAETIWRRLRFASVRGEAEGSASVLEVLEAGPISTELFDFLKGIAAAYGDEATKRVFDFVERIFETQMLTTEYLRSRTAAALASSLYNSIVLARLSSRQIRVFDADRKAVFLAMVRVCLSLEPHRNLDLQGYAIRSEEVRFELARLQFGGPGPEPSGPASGFSASQLDFYR
jgi:hypothetical protein